MQKWLLTVFENKYYSITTYVIDEKSIPLGLTVDDIVLKIISNIVVDTPTEDPFEYAQRVNDCSWVIQYNDYHYDVVLQKIKDVILDISNGLDKPLKDRAKLVNLLRYSDSSVPYEKFKKDIKKAAGIENMKQSFGV